MISIFSAYFSSKEMSDRTFFSDEYDKPCRFMPSKMR